MELKKCKNCGAFITSDSNLCSSCAHMLNYNETILKNYFNDGISCDSIKTVSSSTGISPSLIQNYIIQNNCCDFQINSEDDTYTNLPY